MTSFQITNSSIGLLSFRNRLRLRPLRSPIYPLLSMLVAAALLSPAACDSSSPPPAKPTPSPKTSLKLHEQADQLDDFLGSGDGAAALPPGHPPISASSQPGGRSPTGAPGRQPVIEPAAPDAVLHYDEPADWQKLPAGNPIRKAEFLLPRAPGDPDDARLIVYYFGPNQGGSISANLERWRGMFSTPDGKPIPDEAVQHTTFEANGLKTTLMDIAGRYNDPMGGMHGQAAAESDMRMLAAMIETPDGPWFFKAVGPPATMTGHREAFLQLLKSAKR